MVDDRDVQLYDSQSPTFSSVGVYIQVSFIEETNNAVVGFFAL